MTPTTIEKLNAQARQKCAEEAYRLHLRLELRQKFKPRKRRIANTWPRMARREKLDGEAHL